MSDYETPGIQVGMSSIDLARASARSAEAEFDVLDRVVDGIGKVHGLSTAAALSEPSQAAWNEHGNACRHYEAVIRDLQSRLRSQDAAHEMAMAVLDEKLEETDRRLRSLEELVVDVDDIVRRDATSWQGGLRSNAVDALHEVAARVRVEREVLRQAAGVTGEADGGGSR